jgi:hypothetical protein
MRQKYEKIVLLRFCTDKSLIYVLQVKITKQEYPLLYSLENPINIISATLFTVSFTVSILLCIFIPENIFIINLNWSFKWLKRLWRDFGYRAGI